QQEAISPRDAGWRPAQIAQPFLSPPTVAFLTAPLAGLPLNVAYVVWAFFIFAAFALALAWAGVSRGWARWIAVIGALTPWFVMHAVNVGQVVPLVAAGTVVGWRHLRPPPPRARHRRCACRGLQAPQVARACRAACDRRLADRRSLPARVGSLLAGARGLDGLGGASGHELASSSRHRLGACEPIPL